MTVTKRGLQRFYEYRDRIRGIISQIEASPEPNPVLLKFFGLVLENDEKTIDCIEHDKPLLSSWYGSAPEIYAAMGIHYFCPVDNILAHQPFNNDLEGMDASAVPADMCGLIKLGAYGVETGIVPTPTAIIAMLEPCDAQSALHEAWKNSEAWKDLPTFALDPAYGNGDEDYTYFAGELKRMISFLEEHVGRKMDYNKLREVIEETNRQYAEWSEYNELRRAVPCPHGSFMASKPGWVITQHITAGHPGATEIFKMLAFDAEQRVKEKRGFLVKERIRLLWADLVPTWSDELAAMLAEEWGAVIVQDFQGSTPYAHIDTSTEENMLLGLARRNLGEVPMIRQARGTVDVMIEDITRLTRDYRCDCVIFPGHVGHKDQSASIAFLKEACRYLKVPLLTLSVDNFDPRYAPMETLKHRFAEFFCAHGLG